VSIRLSEIAVVKPSPSSIVSVVDVIDGLIDTSVVALDRDVEIIELDATTDNVATSSAVEIVSGALIVTGCETIIGESMLAVVTVGDCSVVSAATILSTGIAVDEEVAPVLSAVALGSCIIGSAIATPISCVTDDETPVNKVASTDCVRDVVPIGEATAVLLIDVSILCVCIVGCKRSIDNEVVVLISVATENESESIGVAFDFTIGIVCSTRLIVLESFVTVFTFINSGSSVTTTPSHSSESQTRFFVLAPLHSIFFI